MLTTRSVFRRCNRFGGAVALVVVAAMVALSGCTPESALTDVECESDADCEQRGAECDDGYCVVVDAASSQLTVEVEGLPVGLEADVQIQGPEDFEHRIGATETVDELWSGDYTIVAGEVDANGATFEPAEEEQTVSLGVDDEQTATVDYSVQSGGVQLEVSGLVDGADPTVELVDEDGDVVDEFGEDGLLEGLEPGDYTVEPQPYQEDGRVWGANPEDVEVRSGETAEVTVEYILEPGTVVATVIGLPGGESPRIELVRDDDVDHTYTIPAEGGRIEAVEPGTYNLEGQNANTSNGWDSTFELQEREVVVDSNEEKEIDVVFEVAVGSVSFDVSGLEGGDPTIELIDAHGEVVGTSDGTDPIEELEPGEYTVDPSPVQVGDNEWVALDQTIVVNSGEPTEVDVEYAVEPGAVQVNVTGLPGDVEPDLMLKKDLGDADEDGWEVPTSGLVDGLTPGDYDLEVRNVDEPDDGPATWEGHDVEDITVTSHDTNTVEAQYTVIPGKLNVDVGGLDGLDNFAGPASVDVIGPTEDQLDFTEDGDQTIDVDPGSYVVSPLPFDHDGSTYSGQTQTIEVESGETPASVSITFQVATGFGAISLGISGLDDGVDADIDVKDDGGDIVDGGDGITESGTIEGLDPGDYDIEVHAVDDEDLTRFWHDEQDTSFIEDVTVYEGQTTYQEIAYEVEPGDLEIETTDPTDIGVHAIVTDNEDFTRTVEDSSQSVTTSLKPGNYDVEFQRIDDPSDPDHRSFDPDTPVANVDVASEGIATGESVDSSYTVVPGELNVTVDGLEDLEEENAVAEVVVDGGQYDDELFNIAQGETESIDDAEPDDYDVTPHEVFDGETGITYEADGFQNLRLDSEGVVDVTADYEADAGALSVAIEGLPDEVDDSAVDVEIREAGTTDVFATISDSETLEDVPSGEYDIVAQPVEVSPERYTAEPVENVEVSRGMTAFAEVDYELGLGEMTLTVDGTEGLVAEAHLEDSDETFRSVEIDEDSPRVVDGLEPGDWDVEFQRIDDGEGTSYDPVDVDTDMPVTVYSDGLNEDNPSVHATYSVVYATLEVAVDGLEEGSEATIDIQGGGLDDEYDIVQGETEVFDEALPDDFEVTPQDYTDEDGVTWDAPGDSFTLDSEDEYEFVAEYDDVVGALDIAIGGLPDDVDADVTIFGPDSDDEYASLTESDNLEDVPVGSYDIEVEPVPDDEDEYVGEGFEDVEVFRNATTFREVQYEAVPGTIEVTVEGLEGHYADVDVLDEQDGEVLETVSTNSTAESGELKPDDYFVEFPEEVESPDEERLYVLADGEQAGQPVTVNSDAAAPVDATYELESAPGTLVVDLTVPIEDSGGQGLEGQADFVVQDESGQNVGEFIVDPGQTVREFELRDDENYDVLWDDGSIEDRWGNELFLEDLETENESIEAGGTTTHTASTGLPTDITEAVDDPDLRGSLREVLDRVEDDSITTVEGVAQIELADVEGTVELTKPVEIWGDGVEITPEEAMDDQRLFEVSGLEDGESVTLKNMELLGGEGVERGAGLEVESPEGTVSVLDVDFTGHEATDAGGAVFIAANSDVWFDGATFTQNDADDGGALAIGEDAEATFSRVIFDDNEADRGGAVFVEGSADFHEAQFSANEADDGGAVYVDTIGEVDVGKALFESNNADDDGGAVWADGELDIVNSTFSANSANTNNGDGGAVYFGDNADATLLHITMVENDADEGGGLFSDSDGEILMKSSYLNDNTDPADNDLVVGGSAEAVISEGYNLIDMVDDGTLTNGDYEEADSDILNDDADDSVFDELSEEEGDFTAVHPLPPEWDDDQDNPGYLEIPEEDCVDFFGEPVETDQRNADRPFNGECTMGAWEEDGS